MATISRNGHQAGRKNLRSWPSRGIKSSLLDSEIQTCLLKKINPPERKAIALALAESKERETNCRPTTGHAKNGSANTMKKKGLYDNINARKKAGTSRPKSKSTIDPKVYKKMKSKKGGFKP